MTISSRRLPLAAGIAALLLIAVWYFLLWAPQAKGLRAAHQAQATAEQQVAQLRSQEVRLRAILKQVPADKAELAILDAALPDTPRLDQALDLFHQAASATGVTLASLSPSNPTINQGGAPPGQRPSIPSITVTMNVQGSFDQIRAFLAALEALPRTVVVDKVSLTTGTGSSANISARIFYAGKPSP